MGLYRCNGCGQIHPRERRTLREGIEGDGGNRPEDGGALQRGTTRKNLGADRRNGTRDDDFRQGPASVKRGLTNGFKPLAQREGCQVIALNECVLADGLHTAGNIDARKLSAISKGILADFGNGAADGGAGKVRASGKCVIADACYAGTNDDFLDIRVLQERRVVVRIIIHIARAADGQHAVCQRPGDVGAALTGGVRRERVDGSQR